MGIKVRNQLSVKRIQSLSEPGTYLDGNGLYLQIDGRSKSWIFRFQLAGRRRVMGLGPIDRVTLAQARELVVACHAQLRDGIDPIEARAERQKAKTGHSFKTCAEQYIALNEPAWRSPTHIKQWKSTLETYVYPAIGDCLVQDVTVEQVLAIIKPIWSSKTETANRVRGRIEVVLNWAASSGYRSGENPARWRGHLENILPAKASISKVEHHAALPYKEIPAFYLLLNASDGFGVKALQFAILTATRTSETLGALWNEIDLDEKIWTIPADRMKAGREHRIPLAEPALALLRRLSALRMNEFVFPGRSRGRLSNMALLMALRRLNRDDLTAHGFRSTFRDWASEETDFHPDVAEMALAHTVSDKVEAAYRRGDLLKKRRDLMGAWAEFCASAL